MAWSLNLAMHHSGIVTAAAALGSTGSFCPFLRQSRLRVPWGYHAVFLWLQLRRLL